jgi:YfiH family protein
MTGVGTDYRWSTSRSLLCIEPVWPVPATVRAFVTTRQGGLSAGPYASLNLATHVGDDPGVVFRNRERLISSLDLPAEPEWLAQAHGTRVLDCRNSAGSPSSSECADAATTAIPGVVLVVLTADCLPVFFADRHGDRVAVAHAGWRGLAQGVLEATLEAMACNPSELVAWIGPGIEGDCYETGPSVRAAFVAPADQAFFLPAGRPEHFEVDLAALAYSRLEQRGVGWIGRCPLGTFRYPELFYSYRRESVTGRMASVIYLASSKP